MMKTKKGNGMILSALLRVAAAGLLFAALGRHPYSCYQLLPLVVCAVSMHSAYLASQLSREAGCGSLPDARYYSILCYLFI